LGRIVGMLAAATFEERNESMEHPASAVSELRIGSTPFATPCGVLQGAPAALHSFLSQVDPSLQPTYRTNRPWHTVSHPSSSSARSFWGPHCAWGGSWSTTAHAMMHATLNPTMTTRALMTSARVSFEPRMRRRASTSRRRNSWRLPSHGPWHRRPPVGHGSASHRCRPIAGICPLQRAIDRGSFDS